MALRTDRKFCRQHRDELNAEDVARQGRCVEECDSNYTLYTWIFLRYVDSYICI